MNDRVHQIVLIFRDLEPQDQREALRRLQAVEGSGLQKRAILDEAELYRGRVSVGPFATGRCPVCGR